MLVGVASLPLSFPPSGTLAFYSINRPPWANISDPIVKDGFFKVSNRNHSEMTQNANLSCL